MITTNIKAKNVSKHCYLSFIKNSIAVTSVAKTLGIGWKEIIKNIKSFKSPNGRCQVKQFADVTVIDDTYNANLFSCLAALDYLNALSGPGRKIFVFGDMFELGDSSKEQHSKVGHKCIEIDLDRLFTIGKETLHTHSTVNDKIMNEPIQDHKYHFFIVKNLNIIL